MLGLVAWAGATQLVPAAGDEPPALRYRWKAGQTYAYRVTAIDKTGNESDPGAEVRAEAP